MSGTLVRFVEFVLDNSLLLLAGTVAAVLWANVDLGSYEHVVHPLHFWVNDVGMVFFFGLRAIFPVSHPAIPFLLLLAIADDALGLIILAVFYPSGPLSFLGLGELMTTAIVSGLWLRRRRIQSFWPYVVGPGALSWAALYLGGFHPALALVPIVPLMPHSPQDLGLFDPRGASIGHPQSF